MHEMAKELLDAGERDFIDQVIASKNERLAHCWGSWKPFREHHPHNTFHGDAGVYVALKTRTPLSRSIVLPRSTLCSTSSHRATTPSCICRGTACHTRGSRNLLEACAWNSAWRSKMKARRGQTNPADDARSEVHRYAPWRVLGSVRWRRSWK